MPVSLNVPEQLLDPNRIRQELARRHVLDFTTYTYSEYKVNWHHRVLAERLDDFVEGRIKRLMVFMPPRNGKSELVSRRLPAYILGRDPDTSIIACSYGADLANRMNRDVQRIIDSDTYWQVFPGTRLSGENVRTVAYGRYLRNSDIFEVVGHRGYYKSAGVGGPITGMGCYFGIIDDPIKSRAEADSQTYRDNVWDWYTSTFYTRMEKDAAILITLTRWHEDDLAGRLLKAARENPEADQWTVVEFPAIREAIALPDDPRDEGDPLWPNKYPIEVLHKIKATVGSYEWSALFQQHPTPEQGGIIHRSWWRYYTSLPVLDEVIQSWDMAFKDTRSSAYVVGQIWGRKGADKYLMDQVRLKIDFPGTLRAVRAMAARWPEAGAKLVEDKANGPAVIATLRKEISGLIAVEPDGSKEARAHAVSPQIEAGNVYLPDPSIAPWVDDFIEEVAAFPNGAYADQVDAMTQALKRLEHGYRIPDGLELDLSFGSRESPWKV